jgi:hypothetical protein
MNLTYYEFQICLMIRFDTTLKKTITPSLTAERNFCTFNKTMIGHEVTSASH